MLNNRAMRIQLNGDDWMLTGWYPNQWRAQVSMELGVSIPPAVPVIKANVPGSVHTDLLAAGWITDPNLGLKSMDSEWVTHREWSYAKPFIVAEGWIKDRCEIIFEGLDYIGEIYLNGTRIIDFEGMFKPVAVDVTNLLITEAKGTNLLKVIILRSPEVDGQIGYSHEIRKLKSRFNYAWDWCPRIVSVGIWRDVYLTTYSGLKIEDFYPDAELLPGFEVGIVDVTTELSLLAAGFYRFSYRMRNELGELEFEREFSEELLEGGKTITHRLEVGAVSLWWPNGYGAHLLYTVQLEVTDSQGSVCDSVKKQIGFRQIEFRQNEQAPAGALPYSLYVNGRYIFIKGVNWVPISPFYGAVTNEQYGDYLGRFKSMNTNLLRVWGGGIIEKRAFYDYCDRNGLMVWQELLQSSSGIDNDPPDDLDFLLEFEQVARMAIKEKRTHPSLVIWCGGNELMLEGFIPVDDKHPNMAMLKRVIGEHDPKRYYLPASASGPRFCAAAEEFGHGLHHDVHGPWVYMGDEKHYDYFNRDDALLRSETGTPGVSRTELLHKYSGDCAVWPPTKDNPYWVHRGNWWIQWEEMKAWFGPWDLEVDEIEAYAQGSRYIQMESLRYSVEATRRREPQASGFIVWMGNEPFANNANTSLIEVDGMPKPAYYGVQNAFAQLLVSASYERVAYSSGESFKAAIYLHNEDVTLKENALKGNIKREWLIKASLLDMYGECLRNEIYSQESNSKMDLIGELIWTIPLCPLNLFMLRLEVISEGNLVCAANSYLFTVDAAFPFEPLRNLPKVSIKMSQGARKDQVLLFNGDLTAAVGVLVREVDPNVFFEFDQNYLTLLPNQTIALTCRNRPISPHELVVEGFNLID